jgi:hypothetical protein
VEETPILKRLYDLGEEALNRIAEDLLSNPRFTEVVMRAVQKGLETKGRLDRNVQTMLALLNLPSRADITRLLTKLEALQGSLVNLNLKVDRIAERQRAERRRRRKAAAAARGEAPPD